MRDDPFGNLTDWGRVLDTLEDLTENGGLSECQRGLIRILRYKGNWRLREEVLKRVGAIQAPSKELIQQVIAVLDDDNIYYDARIIAGNALIQLLPNAEDAGNGDLHESVRTVAEKLKRTPQPPFFHTTLDRLHSALVPPRVVVN
jgi:hypothetical protein